MSLTLTALLGLTIAQPPAPDYHPWNSRTINLPIQYKQGDRKNINQIQLFVSADKGQTWLLAQSALPTQTEFSYNAPKDGLYWFQMVIVDRQGKKDPANMTSEPPALKVLVDTAPPVATITNVRRDGQDAIVEWRIDDEFPNDAATRIYFRSTASSLEDWTPVTRPEGPRPAVKFRTGTNGPIIVKIVGVDLSGNSSEVSKEVAATSANPSVQTSTSLSPGSMNSPTPSIAPASGQSVLPPPSGVFPISDLGSGPLAPTSPPAPPPIGLVPSTATNPQITQPMSMQPVTAQPTPIQSTAQSNPVAGPGPMNLAITPSMPVVQSQPMVSSSGGSSGSQVAVPTYDARNGVAPISSAMPVNSGTAPPSNPVIEVNRPQVISSLRFDLNYQVEQRGPSGISRVDLWVTRDDGRTWVWWSQHSGQEISPLKVNLATQSNTQPEGLYGFRLVPVSGAGLTDAAPVAGDAPDLRIVVDIKAPIVKVFPPTADPGSTDGLIILWEATDQNFSEEPITLEWSDSPNGPWRPIGSSNEPVQQIGSPAATATKKLANTGRFAWKVPSGLPPRVYLKVAARDLAGNATEQVTRDPVLIDLTKPKARITGIGVSPIVRP